MRQLRSSPAARAAAVVVAFPLVALGLVRLGVVLVGDDSLLESPGALVIPVGIAAFGVIADRWWVCALPAVWAGAWLGVLRIVDLVSGDCSVCSGDDDWGNTPLLYLVVVVFPLTVALAVGVAARRLVERWRAPAAY